jgi:glutamate synthase (NADPH/NADH) large chain
VFSVDALGLRPLWFGETEKEFFASSERGVYPLDTMVKDPKPLAPGEKVALRIRPGRHTEVLNYTDIQKFVASRSQQQDSHPEGNKRVPSALSKLPIAEPLPQRNPSYGGAGLSPLAQLAVAPSPSLWRNNWQSLPPHRMVNIHGVIIIPPLIPTAWLPPRRERYHVEVIQSMTESKKEQVGSLGWDGALAALSHTRMNLADYFKETVAVVTNPAIDRERESAQFSTQTLLGKRPLPQEASVRQPTCWFNFKLLLYWECAVCQRRRPTRGSQSKRHHVVRRHFRDLQ